ncbi:MAG: cytochrome c biogenesis protein ResB [Sedimentisphaerales bacterium]|nr:cytochrome c biogenesis protein ResB [Sedimentisphaerales bacterium]
MSRFRRAVLWAALIAIIALTLLSIYGAFLGANRAQAFFNTLPLAVYWFTLTALLIVGIAVFRRLLQIPALLLMHLGCVLILLGGMWGSTAGHVMQEQLFGIDKVPRSQLQMKIGDQTPRNRVVIEDGNSTGELPFAVRLKDFRMEYYEPGEIIIRNRAGRVWRLPAKPGAQVSLDGPDMITVQKVFGNFKLRAEGDKQVPYDAPGGSNPAVQVVVERPDGTTTAGYVFEYFAPIFTEPIGSDLIYRRAVKDYISEVEIVVDGKTVAAKAIEVNHPLHYGGYHVYQYSLDERGEYTVLEVVSDSGLNLVYGGYVMLIAGVLWQFWGRRTLIAIKSRRRIAPQAEHE